MRQWGETITLFHLLSADETIWKFFSNSATVSVTKDGDRVCDGLRMVSAVSYTWTCKLPGKQFRKN